MRTAILLLLASTVGFAGSWPGFLVDSKCYASEERNVNPLDTMPHVDRDMSYEIQYCAPTAKTKKFAVVQEDWDSLKLDSAGNAKAIALVGNTRKRTVLSVVVKGELNKDTIKVDSISVAK